MKTIFDSLDIIANVVAVYEKSNSVVQTELPILQ